MQIEWVMLAGWVALAAVSTAAGQSFTTTQQFCPVDMSYSNLASMIGRMREYIQRSNQGASTEPLIDHITFQDERTKFELDKDFSLPAVSQGPQVAFDVRYFYSHRDRPISEVLLHLGDNSRELSVSGTDRTLVDGLAALVARDLETSGCSFGGTFPRILGMLFLMLVAYCCLIPPPIAMLHSSRMRIALAVTGLGLVVSLVVLPWSRWLPGTAVRLGEVSFIARHAPLIGFVGTLLGLVALAVSLGPTMGRLLRGKKADNDTGSSDTPE